MGVIESVNIKSYVVSNIRCIRLRIHLVWKFLLVQIRLVVFLSPGYRHIHLLSKDGTAIPPSSLFVNISISELTWGRLRVWNLRWSQVLCFHFADDGWQQHVCTNTFIWYWAFVRLKQGINRVVKNILYSTFPTYLKLLEGTSIFCLFSPLWTKVGVFPPWKP